MDQFTIRLDDITPDMNWDNFYKIKQILDEYNIKPLLGVVPDNRDEYLCLSEPKDDFFAYIRDLQDEGYAIAQHGYKHVYDTEEKGLLNLNPFSEFAGLSYEKQFDKLQKGQQILKEAGIHTEIFMAPGHSYDRNTIKALRNLGYKYITDGFSKRPYYDDGILCIPCKMLESYNGSGIDTLCFHLNRKSESEINKFREFIKKNRDKIVDYDCETLARYAVQKGIREKFEEKKFLVLHQIKAKMAQSDAVSEYMVLTNSKNPILKLLKRLVCVPVLIVKIVKKK